MVMGCTDAEKTHQAEQLVLARAHLHAERYFSALSLLHDIPHTEENATELRLMQALAYFKLEDYPHATTAIEQVHQQAPGLQIVLAYLYLLVGNLEQANYLANGLAHQYRTLPEMMLLKGNISLKAHQYQEAEHHFRTAITMDQTTFKAYIGLGHTALLQRRLLRWL
jgi:Flp pilus assembly protein TadD